MGFCDLTGGCDETGEGSRLVRGPLVPWAAGFEGWLVAQGYSPSSVYHRVCLLAALSRWLEREGLAAAELTDERTELFLEVWRAAGRRTWVSSRSLALPLRYLREVVAIPRPVAVVREGPLEELLDGFGDLPVIETDPVAQQQLREPMPRAHQIRTHRLAGADQVA